MSHSWKNLEVDILGKLFVNNKLIFKMKFYARDIQNFFLKAFSKRFILLVRYIE